MLLLAGVRDFRRPKHEAPTRSLSASPQARAPWGETQEMDADMATFVLDRRRSHADSHPLAGTPFRRADVLHALEETCSASVRDLTCRQVEIRIETREGRLQLGLCAWQRLAKRLVDLVLVAVLLPLALPVLLTVALLIAVTSRGPVFFRQVRVGYRGRTFRIYKFRTMALDAERRLEEDSQLKEIYLQNGCKIPAERDSRITRVGKWLRATSLDELPQLLNVVRGEMSLVGPRPVLPEETSCYGDILAAYTATRPGLTGAWQVRGRSKVSFPARAHLDCENLRNWSLAKDLGVIVSTIPSVLRRDGAF